MLQLNNISLTQFRNYIHQQFSFTEKVVGICGLNGTGKTNLLDAIYYLSFTKSYFGRTDAQNVHQGLAGLRIVGNYLLKHEPQQLVCILRENNKKEFLINGELYKKFSEHIGNYPCVMIAPDDVELVTGSSEERRKFIDTILSQIDKNYLLHLIDYNKLLQQRNSLLKQANEQGSLDEALLGIYSNQLVQKGEYIFEQRKLFTATFLPMVLAYYQKIANKNDAIELVYESQLNVQSFESLLNNTLSKDLALQRTTTGVHKDDIAISMSNIGFKNQASQGQRKSLLFAFKLAEWQTLKNSKGFPPILLLDDVFEKLDETRMHNLLNWVCKEDDGQVFITDTHKERLEKALSRSEINFQMIEL
jgi:DNA replication and repair protein RecF